MPGRPDAASLRPCQQLLKACDVKVCLTDLRWRRFQLTEPLKTFQCGHEAVKQLPRRVASLALA